MTNDLYAPPRSAVADVIPGPLMSRPWQVTLAVRLCWTSALLSLPVVVDVVWFQGPAGVPRSVYVGIMSAVYVPLFALMIVLFVFLARGYRWARVVYSVLTLLGLLGLIQSVPDGFARTWYLGVLNVLVGLLDAATVWLLFTGPANLWFRTRGGRIAPP
jgi:hypothetical protein